MSDVVKKIEAALKVIAEITPPNKSNVAALLHECFVWQYAAKAAAKKLKLAWGDIDDAKIINDKDWYRKNQTGKKLVKDTSTYSIQCEVKSPPNSFSQEKFIEAVASRYRLNKAELMAIAEASTVEGTAPVGFEILEAA